MTSSTVETREAQATRATVTKDTLSVELADGRTIAVPVAWYPRLAQATVAESKTWCLIGGGVGIHWPALDEDISIANLLVGQPSAESQNVVQEMARQPEQTCPRPQADGSLSVSAARGKMKPGAVSAVEVSGSCHGLRRFHFRFSSHRVWPLGGPSSPLRSASSCRAAPLARGRPAEGPEHRLLQREVTQRVHRGTRVANLPGNASQRLLPVLRHSSGRRSRQGAQGRMRLHPGQDAAHPGTAGAAHGHRGSEEERHRGRAGAMCRPNGGSPPVQRAP